MQKNIKCNEKGSALVWVLVICVVFAFLGMAIGAIALSMNNRSIKNNSQQQAYFTARSGLNAVVESLNGDPVKYPFSAYLYNNLINGTHSIVIENIFENIGITDNADEIEGIGKCRIEGSYIKGEVTLKATAEAGGQTEKMTLTARRNQDGGTWPAKVWGNLLKESGVKEKIEIGSIKDRKYNESIKDEEKYLIDFVVYQVNAGDESAHKGKLSIVDDTTTNNFPNQAIFIYVNGSETLEIDGIENWDEDYGPDIFVYLNSGATLNLKSQESIYPIYISAGTTAKVNILDGTKAEVFHINGDLTAVDKNIKFAETSTKVPERIPTSNYNYSANIDPDNGARISKWDVVKYEKDDN